MEVMMMSQKQSEYNQFDAYVCVRKNCNVAGVLVLRVDIVSNLCKNTTAHKLQTDPCYGLCFGFLL